jgi:polyphosphate kinase 2 (PPK2 family)
MTMNYIKQFSVKPGNKVDLGKFDAGFTDKHESHEHALPEIEKYNRKLHDLQYLMYAEGKRSFPICLQGRDAAGKDGSINHVLGAMNPQGCTVTGFKVPSKEEACHDFLWRYHRHTPGKGQVAIFNRSHYRHLPHRCRDARVAGYEVPGADGRHRRDQAKIPRDRARRGKR